MGKIILIDANSVEQTIESLGIFVDGVVQQVQSLDEMVVEFEIPIELVMGDDVNGELFIELEVMP